MRKSAILLLLTILLIAAAVLVWNLKNQTQQVQQSATGIAQSNPASTHSQEIAEPSVSPTAVTHSTPDSKSRLLQISVTDTAILQRKFNDWMNVRGCNPAEGAQNIAEPISVLRQQALNNNPTAASILGRHLIFDPEQDGRAEAKQVLWEAALQGSTCALTNYYMFWERFNLAKRSVKRGLNNKSYVHYTLNIPVTDAGKRQAIINAYAWDLVWEMRTGVDAVPAYWATLASQYHYRFQWTPAEYAQACEEAADLYNQLQSAREAAGYGPFDNSLPPVLLDSPDGPDVGSHCANWPVPKPQCQKAELHAIDRSGVIHAFEAWVCNAQA